MRSAGVRLFGVPLAVAGVLAFAGAMVQACATGDTTETVDDAAGGDTLTDGAGKDTGAEATPDAAKDSGSPDVVLFEAGPGEIDIGQPCKAGDTCAMPGKCTEILTGQSYCTVDCGAGCPTGTYCTTIAGKQLCAPDLGNQCVRCGGSVDCKMPTDQCVTAPKGDKFCARDCTILGDCPSGFTCVEAAGYPGNATSGGGGDAGVDGGASTPHICVPAAGDSCPCDAKRDAVQRSCEVKNASGTCTGTEHCAAATKTWTGCDAKTPATETCNGTDDDCNGKIDDGTGNALCAASGAPPTNAEWTCSTATSPPACALGKCASGWAAYPVPTDPKTGCTCPVEKSEPNNSCAQVSPLGILRDDAPSPLVVTGTLSADGDVDVYTFNAQNTADLTSGPNSFHVSILLEGANNPGGEFVFDVIHGGPCVDTAESNHTALTSYTYCVDGNGSDRGESPCAEDGTASGVAKHCTDHSSPFFIRVHRKASVTATCNAYKMTISTHGGAACDFAAGRCEG